MPRLERREQLSTHNQYWFIRVDDVFGCIKRENTTANIHPHHGLASKYKLHHGKDDRAKRYIVTDGGWFEDRGSYIHIDVAWTATTQVEGMIGFNFQSTDAYSRLDAIQLDIRKETAQKLSNLLGIRVEMNYMYVSIQGKRETFTFEPKSMRME